MNKKIAIVLGALVILGAGYFVYIKIRNANVPEVSSGGGVVVDNEDVGPTEAFRAPTEAERSEFPSGDKVLISSAGGSISVNNFFTKAEGYWPEMGEVLIVKNDKYELVFDRGAANFYLTLLTSASNEDISTIMSEVMNLLGVGKNEICKLNFLYSLEYDVVQKIDLGPLPLCSSVLK